ncbi:transmembrane protein 271 [Cynocephalus volans]|uniref:transmembrane protein 271 n=1 Tax=Cynocephalus volans TaxID=110931 RepID=UPI002FCA6634
MKWSVRGACAALCSCLLLACALSAAAVGLKCFSLGAELRGEPFRLGAAAGAFYSGLLLAAGLSLLGAALLCCGPRAARLAGPGAGAPEAAAGEPGAAAGPPGPARSQNLLLLGVLVFMLGVLSAFAGAVIDGDTVALVERKYSHFCLPPRAPDGASAAGCRRLKDYQRGLVLSTVFNALECLLGLLSLLLVKSYRSSQARRGRRARRRGGRAPARPRGGPGLRARRGRRGRRGRRLQPRPSEAPILSPEEADLAGPGDCAGLAALQAVSYINVGGFGALDEAGAEVRCGGHPSVELPGYAPSDPDLDASYPYCCRPPWEPSFCPASFVPGLRFKFTASVWGRPPPPHLARASPIAGAALATVRSEAGDRTRRTETQSGWHFGNDRLGDTASCDTWPADMDVGTRSELCQGERKYLRRSNRVALPGASCSLGRDLSGGCKTDLPEPHSRGGLAGLNGVNTGSRVASIPTSRVLFVL